MNVGDNKKNLNKRRKLYVIARKKRGNWRKAKMARKKAYSTNWLPWRRRHAFPLRTWPAKREQKDAALYHIVEGPPPVLIDAISTKSSCSPSIYIVDALSCSYVYIMASAIEFQVTLVLFSWRSVVAPLSIPQQQRYTQATSLMLSRVHHQHFVWTLPWCYRAA